MEDSITTDEALKNNSGSYLRVPMCKNALKKVVEIYLFAWFFAKFEMKFVSLWLKKVDGVNLLM